MYFFAPLQLGLQVVVSCVALSYVESPRRADFGSGELLASPKKFSFVISLFRIRGSTILSVRHQETPNLSKP